MFLTPHTSAALWISTKVGDPLLAFVMGFVSHFILDMIPHGDEGLGDHKLTKTGKFFYLLKVALVDMLLAIFLIWYFLVKRPDVDRYILSSAIAGAWIPDLLWVANNVMKLKFITLYTKVHDRIHQTIDYRFSPVYGVPLQIVITLLIVKASLI